MPEADEDAAGDQDAEDAAAADEQEDIDTLERRLAQFQAAERARFGYK